MNGTMKDNVPHVEWNVEIHLLFLPVFVAHGLKVRLPVFVATSLMVNDRPVVSVVRAWGGAMTQTTRCMAGWVAG